MLTDSHQDAPTVARLGKAASMLDDLWAIKTNGHTVAIVAYETARDFWLGRIGLAELVEMVGGGNDNT